MGYIIIHWNFFTDNTSIKEIARDASDTANISKDITEGTNDEGNTGYSAPYPPKGEKHQYQFCIYAVNDVPSDIDASSSFTNEAFKKKYSSIIIGDSCFDAYYTTTPNTTTKDTSSSTAKFKTTTPLRYVTENYKKLEDKDIAKYMKALNKEDKLTLKIFGAFGNYLQYRACRVDKTIVLETLSGSIQNCQQNYNEWLKNLYIDSPYFNQGYTFEQWYYATQASIENLSQAEKDKLFSYAYSSIKSLLTGMKCDSGEIDKTTCQAYFQGQQQYLNSTQQINDTRIRGMQEFTNTNYVCTYDGQVLADTSVCVSTNN